VRLCRYASGSFALNSDAMIVQNQAYASYLRPVEILNARLIKFS